MKQTQNALKFLLAQYRAIFKHAYVKGLATAVLLTAGLAAGQAQAADDKWYTFDSTQSPNFVEHERSDTAVNSGSLALGAGEHNQLNFASDGKLDGVVTGGNLTVGSGGDIEQVVAGNDGLGNAQGGYIFDDGTSGITNFIVDDSHVTLISGGSIEHHMIGAWIDAAKGNITATNNSATIDGGTSTVGLSVYGANITTKDGSATATGNKVTFNADVTDTLSIGGGNFNSMRGVRAEATDSLYLTGNSVTIEISDSNKTDTTTHFTFDKANTLEGALGMLGSGAGANAQAMIANNSVTANNITIGDTSGAFVFGGRGQVDTDNESGVEITARDNIVSLTNTNVVNKATNTSNGESLQIVGNTAWGLQTTVSSGKNSVSALGDGTTANVSINGGNLQFITASSLADNVSGLEQTSMVAGGFAITTASGGSATANANVASIKNTTATNVNFYGGIAYSVAADGSDQVTASQNVLTIDATDVTVNNTTATGYTHNNIAGAVAFLDPTNNSNSGELTAQNRVTASNNTVTLTNSAYKAAEANTAKTVNADIFGALVSTAYKAGNTTANQNTVTVGNGINVTGSVYGVRATNNGTFTDNKVDFNATLKAQTDSSTNAVVPESITGVTLFTGDSGTNTDHTTLTVTGNTVTIGTDAKVENASIEAVALAANNATYNDIIHSGNTVIVNGDYLVNDSSTTTKYDLAADVIQINSTAQIYVKDGTLNISGISNGAASPEYYNGTGTVANGAMIANADAINVYNSLDVQGDSTLVAVANGALLTVDGGKAKEEYSEDFAPVTTESATLKISQAGLTNYLTATENLAYDLDGDAAQFKEANDAAGAAKVTSGGTIDFRDTVVLSDFNFTTTAPTPGQIQVDTTIDPDQHSGSYFKADTVTVAHKLATNTTSAQGKYGNLQALGTTDGVAIIANTLNLGASTLSSDQSAAIKFGQATVKDEINFIARTSGKDISDDDGTELGTFNDGYHLTSKEPLKDSSSLPDATLNLSAGLVLDVSQAGSGTVTANGNIGSAYRYPDTDDFYGDNRYVELDLTAGVDMKTATNGNISGKATIEATSGGVVLLNASDVNDLLAQNHAWNDKAGGTNNNQSQRRWSSGHPY